MSVAAIAARVAEIQSLVQRATTPPDGAFRSVLQSAQASPVVPAGLTGDGTPAPADATALPATGAAGATGATGAAGDVPAGVPSSGGDGGQYAPLIRAAAARHGLDPQIFTNLVRQESGFDPNAGSSAGARGLCQLMPGTAATLGVRDLTDPAQSLEGGAKYLRQQLDRFGGDYRKALAAYNAGPGAVQRYGGVPPYPETQHYVATILGPQNGAVRA